MSVTELTTVGAGTTAASAAPSLTAPSAGPPAAASAAPAGASNAAAAVTSHSAEPSLEDVFARMVVPKKNEHPAQDTRPILFYDGQCKVCSAIAAWVKRHDDPQSGGLQLVDERAIGFDGEGIKALSPKLDIMQLYAEVHLLMPDGTVKRGGEAIAEVLTRLPPTRWLTPLVRLRIGDARPFVALVHLAYKTIDALRPALGCTSCGKPVPWWGKPIYWAVQAYQALKPAQPTS